MQHIEFTRDTLTLRGTAHKPAESCGTWVVFAHGFTSHRMGPEYLHVALSRELERHAIGSLRFDFAGCGESDGEFHDMTPASMQADLQAAVEFVCNGYTAGRIILLGHSLGGAIAASCCTTIAPQGIILLAPVAFPMDHARGYEPLLQAARNVHGRYDFGAHEMSGQFFNELSLLDPVAALLGRACPLLVLRGSQDQRISEREACAYTDLQSLNQSSGRYISIAGADHRFSAIECRRQLGHHLTQWIKETVL